MKKHSLLDHMVSWNYIMQVHHSTISKYWKHPGPDGRSGLQRYNTYQRMTSAECQATGVLVIKKRYMKQYPSDREQEEEEDMERINHSKEAGRCIKTLSKPWKKTVQTAKVLGGKKSYVWCPNSTICGLHIVSILPVVDKMNMSVYLFHRIIVDT